jgi:hypothetical protein
MHYVFIFLGQAVLLCSCILAFFLNYSIFLNTTLNSPLTQTICGNLKVCVYQLLFASCMYIPHSFAYDGAQTVQGHLGRVHPVHKRYMSFLGHNYLYSCSEICWLSHSCRIFLPLDLAGYFLAGFHLIL